MRNATEDALTTLNEATQIAISAIRKEMREKEKQNTRTIILIQRIEKYIEFEKAFNADNDERHDERDDLLEDIREWLYS